MPSLSQGDALCAVLYVETSVFLFQNSVKKKRHPPQNAPFFQTKGNKNAV